MTKISIVLMLCFCSLAGMAQSLDDINKMMGDKKFNEAKVAIDKHLADPKNAAKSDAWYFKGRVYNSLSYDNAVEPGLAYDYKLAAYDAFKKNQELDKNDIRLKVEAYRSYLDLYLGLYDLGAKFYNNKDYKNAFNAFTKALEVKDFMMGKQYNFTEVKLNALDTSLVLNTAIAASQDKNEEMAVKYYRVLTDANVTDKNFQEVYEFLADHYSKKGDTANMLAIVEKGKRFYPQNEYWNDLEMETVRKSGDKALLFAKYEEQIAKNPSSFIMPYNYSIDLFNNLYAKDAKPDNIDAAREKLTATLKAAIANDKGIDASVLMTKHLYNVSSDLSIATNLVKGTKPEDVKKKAALAAETSKKMDEFLTYGQAVAAYFDAQPTLKPVQKATYQELLSNMSEVYNYKKNAAKAAEMDKKRLALK
jgi:hypothetical protein